MQPFAMVGSCPRVEIPVEPPASADHNCTTVQWGANDRIVFSAHQVRLFHFVYQNFPKVVEC
jgi:hypothetical protein